MFSFLSPAFLAGAAAAIIPLAIHLFFRRTDPVIDFAAMRYLRQAPVEQAHRRRLRELLLLALRIGAVVLLALAFARPYLSAAAARADAVTLVLIDRSASMTAPGQFDRARALAEQAVRDAPATHAVGAMTFAGTADVVSPISEDRAAARAAIGQLQPGAGRSRYQTALQRAAQEIGDRSGRIVVVTDLQQSGWEATDEAGVPARIAVQVADAGRPQSNVAVTSLAVEGAEAVATISNFAAAATTREVTFSIDERSIGRVAVTVPAGSALDARLSIEGQQPGTLRASVDDAVGYASDNQRFAVMSSRAPLVLAITAGADPSESLYLGRAVDLVEGARGFRFRAVSGETFSAQSAADLEGVHAIVVLDGRRLDQGGRQRLAAFVRSGGGVVLTGAADVDSALMGQLLAGIAGTTWTARAALTAPVALAPADVRHPIFRAFDGLGTLGNVRFTGAALLRPGAAADVLARFSDGSPALVEERGVKGRVLLLASDLNNRWNDFPLQPAFVPFVHEMLNYLAASPSRPAEYLVGDLPAPEGEAPGVHTAPGNAAGQVAVNVDPRESDPMPMEISAFTAGVAGMNAVASRLAGAAARQNEDDQNLWQYALLLMMISVVGEGMLGRRMG